MDYLIDVFFKVIVNFPLMIALTSMAIAQIAKLIYYYFREGELNLYHFIEAGGMPSAHSATASSMTMAIGLTSGFASPFFALSFIFSLVVMYDAMGVRRAASKQAFILNKIVDDMYGDNKGKIEKLKELMGHSPVEVLVGSVLGIAVSIVLYALIYSV
jgi:hypothetical protein